MEEFLIDHKYLTWIGYALAAAVVALAVWFIVILTLHVVVLLIEKTADLAIKTAPKFVLLITLPFWGPVLLVKKCWEGLRQRKKKRVHKKKSQKEKAAKEKFAQGWKDDMNTVKEADKIAELKKLPPAPINPAFQELLNSTPKIEANRPGEAIRNPFQELKEMIGLKEVKTKINDIVNLVNMEKQRKGVGLPTADMTHHLVFTGNPGTGKTTVARLIGDIYNNLGVLDKGHLVETNRNGLIGRYIGRTGPKTEKIINDALDGVLFIDEAYSLIPKDSEKDFGQEAIATLLIGMENNKSRLVVIVAGYKDDMERFINSNPGLKSRFKNFINFDDFKKPELVEIFKKMCADSKYIVSPEAERTLDKAMGKLSSDREQGFGNGRAVRNLFEECLTRHANRLGGRGGASLEELMTLTAEDITI